MILEAKSESPITLKLSTKENICVSGDENISLETGVVFGGDHYGFTLIVSKGTEETTANYPTQCRIYGAQITNGQLNVFEDHKYIPWRFDLEGNLLNNAVFSNLKRDELDYIAETYGVKNDEDLEKLNNYRKSTKR